MDLGSANDEPFLIRANFGIMADMVTEASRELKDKVGQLAYGLTAIKTLINAQPLSFRLRIDGEQVEESAVALTVTNCGSIGIGDYTFLPDISTQDGLLDVLLIHKADLLSVLRVAGSTLLQTDSQVLRHWQCREIEIESDSENFILDDEQRSNNRLFIKVVPKALRVIVPV